MAKLTYNEIHNEAQDQTAYCDNCHHLAKNHEIDWEGNDTFCHHCDKRGNNDCNCRSFDDYDNWKPKRKSEVDTWDETSWFKKHAKKTVTKRDDGVIEITWESNGRKMMDWDFSGKLN